MLVDYVWYCAGVCVHCVVECVVVVVECWHVMEWHRIVVCLYGLFILVGCSLRVLDVFAVSLLGIVFGL